MLTLDCRSLKEVRNEVNFLVDLDVEQGRNDSRQTNVFRVVVRPTKAVNLTVVQELLRGNKSMAGDALEGLSKDFLNSFLTVSSARFAN